MVLKKRNAFTMIEILVVVFIIGLLATLIGPRLVKMITKGEISATKATMAALKSSLVEYRQDMGHFPTKREGDLEALIVSPNTKAAGQYWSKDGYLEGTDEVPLDGWKNDFEYNCPPEVYKKKYKYYEIISEGPEGENAPIHAGA